MRAKLGIATGAAILCLLTALGYATTPQDKIGVTPPVKMAAIAAALDGIALASPRAAAVREASADSAWGGVRKPGDATLSDRVVAYDISAKLDPIKHTVDGTEKLTWRNRSAIPVRSVYLHLYLNAFEGSQSTFFTEKRTEGDAFRSNVRTHDGEWGYIDLQKVAQAGKSVPWLYVHPDGGPETDHTVVRLDLPEAVAPGASTDIDLQFHDQLPRVVARTGYFGTFHLVGQWFPKIAVLELPGERGAKEVQWNAHEFHLHSEFYADYGKYDVKLTVPEKYTVGAVGEEVSPPQISSGWATHHFVQEDVHDFAWTADERTAKPLEAEYRGEGSPVVKIKVLFPPEYKEAAQAVLQATQNSLAYFSRTLGPYPYRTVTAVVPPHNANEAGGMEYPTFFTAENAATVEPGTLSQGAIDFVTIHEFGHGYFYGILGSNEFEEPMLDEGLNQYWDMRMLREANEPLYLATPFLKKLGFSSSASGFDIDRIFMSRDNPVDALGGNSWDRFSGAGYSSVYSRTSITMHDLEEALGKDKLEAAFKEYYRRWKFRHPSIADLRETLAQSTGERALVERVFNEQVYAVNRVDDRVEKFSSEEDLPDVGTVIKDGQRVELTENAISEQIEKQRDQWEKTHPDAKKGTGPFPYRTSLTLGHRGVPVRQHVVVKFSDGSEESFIWDDEGRWKRYTWVKPVKAVSVEIDPEDHNMLDANVLDNSRTIESDGRASRRLAGDFGTILQTLFSLVASL